MNSPEVRWAAKAGDIRAAEAEPLAREGEAALMDRAAAAVADAAAGLLAERNIDAAGTRAVLLVGTGNNGGDALLAGALMAAAGATVTAIQVGDAAHTRGLAALREAGGTVISRAGSLGPRLRHRGFRSGLLFRGRAPRGCQPRRRRDRWPRRERRASGARRLARGCDPRVRDRPRR